LHGGQIAAFSDGIGKGSEFVVTLPLPGAELQEVEVTQAKTGTDAPEQGLRILVVDDNPDAAESIAMLLELDGHQVEVAYGALEALEKARRLQPEAMLLDLGLPQIDGYELARRLRADPVTREAVLIALSGYGQPEHLVRSREAGFDHHLVKPAEPRTLSDLLNSLRQK
jgi:two-component system CheB/CheR fusion protein